MEENKKIMYVCDRRACKTTFYADKEEVFKAYCCNSQCKHTSNIEHAKNFHLEGDTFFEDDTLNNKVKNQAKEIRRLLKRIDWLENHYNFKKPPKETRVLEEKIKAVVAHNNQLKTLLAHYLLKAYEDRPELISQELKEMINRYAQDTEIERLLGKNQ